MTWIVSRRRVLRNGALTASLLVGSKILAPGSAIASPSLEAFIAMSAKLTGQPSLNDDMGKTILDAFIASGQGDDIAALIADPAPENSKSKIANAVVAAWYSGISPLSGANQVTGFNEALVWSALSYTKPWGSCGGDAGYWSEAPLGEEP
ncbi:sugar dehydrogenase complex small subunit [Pseudoxanthobacter sp. M-2]|uniref:sugar dehydrogenase complex small subunit n=1 Tax=Pseudoxanthobacter sp. M-2 TaxID=3078754 RepID=UPI0038FC1E26